MFRLVLGLLLLSALTATTALAADIEGKATVIDAGTIDVGNQRIRLFGIAAPVADQVCTADGRPWNCGREAAWALAFELAEHWVICRDKGLGSAMCFIGGSHDIAEIMVRKGWARADRSVGQDYVAAETEAQANHAGLWRGFTP